MSYDAGSALGASALADVASIYGSLQTPLLAPSEGDSQATGLRGVTNHAGERRRLTASAKYRIELDANRAAKDGISRREGCCWPYDSLEGDHWLACYLIAGGKP